MARLNVEDEWFITDPRRGKLVALVGCAFRADGMALAAWRLSQRYWRENQQPIPEDIWELSDLEPLIQAKLARRVEGGVYVSGTEDAFNWLMAPEEFGRMGGKASAKARFQKHGTAQPQRKNPEPPSNPPSKPFEPPSSLLRSRSNPPPNKLPNPEPSYSSSVSNSPSSGQATAHARVDPPAPAPEAVPGRGEGDLSSPAKLLTTWNEHRGNLAEALGLTPSRTAIAYDRLGERPDLAYWAGIVQRIAAARFPKSEFKPTFDWLIAPGNHVKVAEGILDNKKPKRLRNVLDVPEREPAGPPACAACLDEGYLGPLLPVDRANVPRPEVELCSCAAGDFWRGEIEKRNEELAT